MNAFQKHLKKALEGHVKRTTAADRVLIGAPTCTPGQLAAAEKLLSWDHAVGGMLCTLIRECTGVDIPTKVIKGVGGLRFSPFSCVIVQGKVSNHGYRVDVPYIVHNGKNGTLYGSPAEMETSVNETTDKVRLCTDEEIDEMWDFLTLEQIGRMMNDPLIQPYLLVTEVEEATEDPDDDKGDQAVEKS